MPNFRNAVLLNGIPQQGLVSALVAKTGAYTLTANDSVVLGNASGGAFTLTLPTAAGLAAGRVYTLKKTDSSANAITIATTSSQTIDGGSNPTLSRQWQYIQVISDGSNWQIIDGTALLDTTAADFQTAGPAGSAGATGKYADAGHRHPLNSNSITANLAAITNTDTVIINLPIVPANVILGSMFHAAIHGTWTNAATAVAQTFTVRAGTNGTTADTSVGTFVPSNSTTAQTATGIMLDLWLTIQAVGTTGQVQGVLYSFCTSAGFVGQATGIQQISATATFNTVTATFLTLTFKTGSASNNLAVRQAMFAQVA